jgi:putative hemolysin
MISVGSESGTVEAVEAEMLEKVFHFGDRQVQEIMTPRTEIVWVERDTTLAEFLAIYSQQTHTRFPVYEDDKENVTGILSVKDLLQTMAQDSLRPDSKVANVLRPAYFVPETKLIGELFSELRLAGQQMAIVIDQHGGVAGLVTLKSLLEVIVGPVGEEGEPAQDEFSAIGENVYDVDAGMGIQEANGDLSLGLPEGDYQTLAGFILEQLGHIPQEGEHVYYRDLRLEITKMTRLKIDRVQIQWIGQPVEQRGA